MWPSLRHTQQPIRYPAAAKGHWAGLCPCSLQKNSVTFTASLCHVPTSCISGSKRSWQSMVQSLHLCHREIPANLVTLLPVIKLTEVSASYGGHDVTLASGGEQPPARLVMQQQLASDSVPRCSCFYKDKNLEEAVAKGQTFISS